MDGGAWWATVHGVTKSQAQLKRLSTHVYTHTHTHTHTRARARAECSNQDICSFLSISGKPLEGLNGKEIAMILVSHCW